MINFLLLFLYPGNSPIHHVVPPCAVTAPVVPISDRGVDLIQNS